MLLFVSVVENFLFFFDCGLCEAWLACKRSTGKLHTSWEHSLLTATLGSMWHIRATPHTYRPRWDSQCKVPEENNRCGPGRAIRERLEKKKKKRRQPVAVPKISQIWLTKHCFNNHPATMQLPQSSNWQNLGRRRALRFMRPFQAISLHLDCFLC